jgi:TetR/AcrR family transcriptional regulator
LLLQFAEKNPGMARVMVGDALVLEHERLQQRMNLFFDKFEAQLKQCLRQSAASAQPVDGGSATSSASAPADNTPDAHAQARAALLTAFCMGQLQRYVRSGFKRMPTEQLTQRLVLVLN